MKPTEARSQNPGPEEQEDGIARLHQVAAQNLETAPPVLVSYLAVPDARLTRLHISPHFKHLVNGNGAHGAYLKDHDRWVQYLHPEDRERVQQTLARTREAQSPYCIDYRLSDGHGVIRWVRDMGIYVGDPQQGGTVIQGVMMDVSLEHELRDRIEALAEQVRRAEAEAAASKASELLQQMHETLEHTASAILRLDAAGKISYANQAALRLTGHARPELLGHDFTQALLTAPEGRRPHGNPSQYLKDCSEALRSRHPRHLQGLTLWRKDARPLEINCQISPGAEGGAILTLEDATEYRSLSTQLQYQVTHDALTGLLNRRELLIRLEQALRQARHGHNTGAMLYIDLDQFKVINDTSGHTAGDELLRQISSLLTGAIRQGDALARLGGDEFAVILNDCPASEIMDTADQLRTHIAEHVFRWEDKTYNVTASIGVVPINRESGNVITVMSAADTACHSAKDKGRNRIHAFKLDDTSMIRRQGEMRWVARIHQAVQEGRFSLFAQTIQPVETAGKERGAHLEMLIKMQGEGDELIPPGVFLPAAERYNLSGTIDRWVLQHTFSWIADAGLDANRLSLCAINLSGHSVGDPAFLDYVVSQLKRHALPPTLICFEITETVAIANLNLARTMMETLGGMGCRFALDDFGSGMSSFGYLRTLPVDYLKIDGLFVKDIAKDTTDLALVRSINDIAHVMGKRTIAEFVESQEILDHLQEMGVDYAQGNFIAEPVPVAQLKI
ncbi:EAL domain-containing protein [Thioalkalivibrio sulfidiphilus]|uniref:EAL domain-containing protein n=1 Tax=Thioalkalivibrio sulfidiphilus TaxID=1033854 RepID=UPI000369802A|nr:EAL domain-containing protein [Thioalkalivibrio sulfidiphilus]